MEPKFLVDVNVGRLAKWLRILGYDATFIPNADDDLLINVASEEKRTLLTRDSYIMDRRKVASGEVKALLIPSEHVWEQLKYVVDAMGLNSDERFSRCIECNIPLNPLPKESTRELVPPFVYATQEDFMRCHRCSKIYWKGTHWSNMRQELTKISVTLT